MKKIFFYGCSFTAGDELSDSDYPELCNHPDLGSYHAARKKLIASASFNKEYLQKNKERAYPAKVSAMGFDCENFAENGAGLEEMICKITMHVADRREPDVVVLQIPPLFREALFLNHHPFVDTLMLTSTGMNSNAEKYRNYMEARIMSFQDSHFAIGDLIKLHMLKYVLYQQNIKFYLIDMVEYLQLRFSLATDQSYRSVIDSIKQIPILHVNPITLTTPDAHCFAGHFNEKMHRIIADEIVTLLG